MNAFQLSSIPWPGCMLLYMYSMFMVVFRFMFVVAFVFMLMLYDGMKDGVVLMLLFSQVWFQGMYLTSWLWSRRPSSELSMRMGLTGAAFGRGGSGQYIGPFCCLPKMDGAGEGIAVLGNGKLPVTGDTEEL